MATAGYKSSVILFFIMAGVASGQYFQLTIPNTTSGKYVQGQGSIVEDNNVRTAPSLTSFAAAVGGKGGNVA